jgi:uncharacterized membrane protein YfcA
MHGARTCAILVPDEILRGTGAASCRNARRHLQHGGKHRIVGQLPGAARAWGAAAQRQHDQHRVARTHRRWLGGKFPAGTRRAGVLRLGAVTALGGAAGAAVLLVTPATTFTVVVPALIGAASVVLLVQPRIKKLVPAPAEGHRLVNGIALFAVAMYVGYFGAAAGVMLLVVLSIMIEESLVKVNAVKNAVSGMANATAAVCFALFGDVRWAFVVPLAAGFLIGGWIGPKIARRVPAGAFRVIISLCGMGLAIKLGISAYH